MGLFSDPLIGVAMDGNHITLSELRIKKGRVLLLRSVVEQIGPEETAAGTILLMVRALGLKRARLFVASASDALEHKRYPLPPMNKKAAGRYLSAKLSSDLSLPQDEILWDAALPGLRKGDKPLPVMTLAAHHRLCESFEALEDQGLLVEGFSSTSMSLWRVAEFFDLLKGKDALLIHIGTEKTTFSGAGPGGPFFSRFIEMGTGAQTEKEDEPGEEDGLASADESRALLAQALPGEVDHALIYMQQHLRKRVSQIILITNDPASLDLLQKSGRLEGLSMSTFPSAASPVLTALPIRKEGQENVASEALSDSVLLSALIPLIGRAPSFLNVMRQSVAARRQAKRIGRVALLASGLLLFGVLKVGLDLGVSEFQLSRKLEALRRLATAAQEVKPEKQSVDWQMIEKQARRQFVSAVDLHFPPLPETLRELALVTPKAIRFKSLSLASADASGAGRLRARKARRRSKSAANAGKGGEQVWSMEISGEMEGTSYAQLQKQFRKWYESLAISPYLAKLNIEKMKLRGGAAGGKKTGKATTLSKMSFQVTADVLAEEAFEEKIEETLHYAQSTP